MIMADRAITAEQPHLAMIRMILAQTLPAHAKVWAFGSRTRSGDVRRGADLDLAIDAGERLTLGQQADLRAAFTDSDLPYKVDILDMHDASDLFLQGIEADMIPLPFAGAAAADI